MWDTTSAFGQRVERRLAEEAVIWLVTTAADGTPQPSPVWFIREGETLLIFSKPDAPKVRNIRARPRVALHFNTDAHGEDVIVFTGTAALDADAPAAHELPAYLAKYGPQIPSIGMTPEQMGQVYAQAIRVRLEKVRGF
jgi:PPOX class probable F420-dependent enzyme